MDENAPIIVTAQLGKGDQIWADGLRAAHFPPERNFLKAHITLFHHLPSTHLQEIRMRLARLAREYAAPPAMLSDVMLLGRGVAFRVDCPGLMAMRDSLAADFTGLLTPQDQARPRLHITIQNKVEPAIARRLHAELLAGFTPRPLVIKELVAWRYLGGPWEEVQRWSFSGQARAD